MNESLKHRGPDSQDFLTYNGVVSNYHLGATRLNIINEDNNSNQPFLSHDKRFALLFNGEVYNYEELKSHHALKDFAFITSSDTEVILAHLIVRGKEAIQDFDGMFSFVFLDSQKENILCARDSSGIKPFYYYHSGDQLIISSEIQGILSSGLYKGEINSSEIEHYVQYRYAEAPQTFYNGIFELGAGQLLSYKNALPEIENYTVSQSISLEKSLENQFTKSVLEQTPKDQKVGLLFSGGADSTLILTILQKKGYKNIICYTIGNFEFGTDDIAFAKKLTKHFNVQHEVIEIQERDLERFSDYIQILDQPIADGAGFLTWLITKKASENVKIMLSGAGADELFGGYNRHRAYNKYLKYFAKNSIARAGFKSYTKLISDKKSRHYKMFANSISSNPITTYNNFRSLRTQNLITNSIQKSVSPSNDDLLLNALELDRMDYLVNDVLKITDNLSMQNSVEVRVPFLSNDIILFSKKYTSKELFSGPPKWMLSEILEKYLPKELIDRPKQGFGMPFGKWIKEGKLEDIIRPLKNSGHHIFNQLNFNEVQSMIKLHMDGKDDFSNEIWALCTLAHWIDLKTEN